MTVRSDVGLRVPLPSRTHEQAFIEQPSPDPVDLGMEEYNDAAFRLIYQEPGRG